METQKKLLSARVWSCSSCGKLSELFHQSGLTMSLSTLKSLLSEESICVICSSCGESNLIKLDGHLSNFIIREEVPCSGMV